MDDVVQLNETGFTDRLARSKSRASRNRVANCRVTANELIELEDAARRGGKALSEWAREVLLGEARRVSTDVVVTELVAVRMLLVNLLQPLINGQKLTPERLAEVMAVVRREKHKAAREVLDQYAALPQEGR